jgi:hypothetical protein
MENQQQQRQQLEQQLIEKAMKDETFRKQLIENPIETIESEIGMKLPSGMNIKVLEEKPEEVYLVLPMLHPSDQEGELTESELNKVAGGIPPDPDSVDWSCTCFCF